MRWRATLVAVVMLAACGGDGDDDLSAYCAQLEELRRIDQQLLEIDPRDERETDQGLARFLADVDRIVDLAPEEVDDDVSTLAAWLRALDDARSLLGDPDDLDALGAYDRALDELPEVAPAVARIRSHARRACGIEL